MNVLTEKYGPLPGWAWLGLAAGGVYLYLRSRGSGSTDSSGSSDAFSPVGTPTYVQNASASTATAPSNPWWNSLTPKGRRKLKNIAKKQGIK